jgi:cytochrome P450
VNETIPSRLGYDSWCRGELADPYPLYDWLREHDPVHWCAPTQSWVLTRYRDVTACLQTTEVTAARLGPLFAAIPPEVRARLDALSAHLATWVQHHDGPEHSRLRAAARSHFVPRTIESWRDRIEMITDALLDGLPPSRDIAESFAHPLPAIVLAELLGLLARIGRRDTGSTRAHPPWPTARSASERAPRPPQGMRRACRRRPHRPARPGLRAREPHGCLLQEREAATARTGRPTSHSIARPRSTRLWPRVAPACRARGSR